MDDIANITFEKLQAAYNAIKPVLYYGAEESIERGVYYLCKETKYTPEFIVMHPDDFESVKRSLGNMRLVHIRDEPKEDVIKRIGASLIPTKPFVWRGE